MCSIETNPNNDADGRDAGCGHDFGAVGDEVEEDGDDGFGPVVELVPQHRGEVAARARVGTQSEWKNRAPERF